MGGTLATSAAGGTRGFLAGETNGRWGPLYVVPGGATTTITALSCPAVGYCAAGGQRQPGLNSGTATVLVIDEAAGHWGKPASLYTGPYAQVGTNSLYAISCAAPRDCAAGGDIAGFGAFPYAFFASEKPVK